MTFLHSANYPMYMSQYVQNTLYFDLYLKTFMFQDFKSEEDVTYFRQLNLIFQWNELFLFPFLVISGVVYCLFGVVLAFSYGGVADKFIGTTFVYHNELIVYVSILFQSTFASVTSSIVAGAIAERCKLIAYFINTVFISGIKPFSFFSFIFERNFL